ncbi:bacteriochlorophyll 4-vinyl reductase [uncultured Roseovarius sp.]|uniref:bacteriochlorophyll 4-vinyl reductase n=1 Tax=uncultured Roseovarius sp. TaxID=293344 RepID=UPI0025F0C4F7|nr:bacteriochlorophyll 4-vinyl reductase [uncultured Roseovarius sp.]
MTHTRGIDLVGPNAVLQSIEALYSLCGHEATRRIVTKAGLRRFLESPPKNMVPARDAACLHTAIARELPTTLASNVARQAGRKTGEYILAHRIPHSAQWVLRALPARFSGPLLLRAICQHSWTFAGDAFVSYQITNPMTLSIQDNPLAIDGCTWHRTVLETLFRRLVSQRTVVDHPACCAHRGRKCRFILHQLGQIGA